MSGEQKISRRGMTGATDGLGRSDRKADRASDIMLALFSWPFALIPVAVVPSSTSIHPIQLLISIAVLAAGMVRAYRCTRYGAYWTLKIFFGLLTGGDVLLLSSAVLLLAFLPVVFSG